MFSKRPKPPAPSAGENENLWSDLRQSLRSQFPNPERRGCPGPAVLKRIASGRMGLEEAQTWLDHFSRCSSCFREFQSLKQQENRQHRTYWAVAAAVALVGGFTLVWAIHVNRFPRRAQVPAPPTTVAKLQPMRTSAVIVLDDASEMRGAENSPPHMARSLPRGPVALSIYLPFGSEVGRYQVEILRDPSDPSPVVTFQGIATKENGSSVLHLDSDFAAFEPGVYTLRVRLFSGPWRYSRISIQ